MRDIIKLIKAFIENPEIIEYVLWGTGIIVTGGILIALFRKIGAIIGIIMIAIIILGTILGWF